MARFSARRRWWVIGVWLLVSVSLAPLALALSGALSGAGWEAQGSVAQQVRDELRTEFPQVGAESAVVVYRQPTPIREDPAALQALVADLQGAPGSVAVADPLAQPPEAGLV